MDNFSADSIPGALVTGGAVRVGRAISLALAGVGYHVAVHAHQSVSCARSLEAEIINNGGRCTLLFEDLVIPGAAKRLVDSAISEIGRLDLVVNNAALFARDDAPVVELAKLRVLNSEAPVSIAQASRAFLVESRGCMVDIADVAAIERFEKCRAYSTSKRIVVQNALERARSWAVDGIRVNVVCPGTVAPHPSLGEEELSRIRSRIPFGEFGDVEDVARSVVFFAQSRFITGQVLCVDGGMISLDPPRTFRGGG